MVSGSATYKAVGGIIRVSVEEVDGRIKDIEITIDFEIHPEDAIHHIEQALIYSKTKGREILTHLKMEFSRLKIKSPGVTPVDFEQAIKLALDVT